ncbi:MAG TPA: AsmA-like C-terminal region-containing protein, partial [Chthoniobacterales bacterium]
MGKFVRLAGIVAGVVLLLLATLALGLNLYVQSLGTQARIQQELSHRLGAPVRIKSISVTPWSGLSLSGITIAQSAAADAPDFLSARSFELHAGLFSIFSGKLIIKKIALVSPRVVWPQNEDGKWRLPGDRRNGKGGVAREAQNTETVAPPAPAATPDEDTRPSAAAAEKPPEPPRVAIAQGPPALAPALPSVLVADVQRATVRDGEFRFLDQSSHLVAAFEGVDFHAVIQNLASLRGVARISRMSARDRFFLEDLRSPFHYDEHELDLPKISGRAAGGEVNGAFHMQPQSPQSPFKASLKFHGLQADEIVSDAGGSHGMIQGKLEGSFAGEGNAADVNELTGSGEVILHDGQLQQYSLLVALGQMLQIDELTQLHLEQAQAKYHVTPGLVTIDELVLRSPNMRLSATGTVTFEGKLKLNSELAINDKVRGQLFKPIRENFKPIAEEGYYAIDFEVGGTVDRPKTNLVDRVIGRDLKD